MQCGTAANPTDKSLLPASECVLLNTGLYCPDRLQQEVETGRRTARRPPSVCLALGLLVAANLKVLAPLRAHSPVLLHACHRGISGGEAAQATGLLLTGSAT